MSDDMQFNPGEARSVIYPVHVLGFSNADDDESVALAGMGINEFRRCLDKARGDAVAENQVLRDFIRSWDGSGGGMRIHVGSPNITTHIRRVPNSTLIVEPEDFKNIRYGDRYVEIQCGIINPVAGLQNDFVDGGLVIYSNERSGSRDLNLYGRLELTYDLEAGKDFSADSSLDALFDHIREHYGPYCKQTKRRKYLGAPKHRREVREIEYRVHELVSDQLNRLSRLG